MLHLYKEADFAAEMRAQRTCQNSISNGMTLTANFATICDQWLIQSEKHVLNYRAVNESGLTTRTGCAHTSGDSPNLGANAQATLGGLPPITTRPDGNAGTALSC